MNNPKFRRYFELLIEWNAKMNLTAITDERDVETLHFRDSLAVADWIAEETPSVALRATPPSKREAKSPSKRGRSAEPTGGAVTLIDVGSGAGFPGLPVAIELPDIGVTLLDATQKRVDFLKTVAAELELTNVECICGRAEDVSGAKIFTDNAKISKIVSRETILRETFSVATARAVSRLNELCELCLPLVRVGGAFIAMKSVDTDAELAEAANAIAVLGGELEEVRDYTIEGTDVRHRLVIIRKIASTPPQYPRRYAKIQKQPL
ncbi:MAG: 16S rRNA (guanine(527)-N(7))-methyltransferase RsmG [Oscillospiraceae bacterium]|jgi:16S rRNA (guanine527-N7)-methyltransferase|nr:16S rRNA (guanine(527)-N(7))-methyltransferase RsmG [Oscillospiraceae bacterium]